MKEYIDQAYELYESKQWHLAHQVIMKGEDYNTNPVALNLIGSIYWKLGNKKEAKKYFLLSAKCRSDFWPAYFNLGNLFYESNDLDKAIKYYTGALIHKGEHFLLFYNIGTCYLKKKKYKKAIAYLKKAIMLKPSHLQSNINLAKAYYLSRDYRKAFIYYNTALAVDGDNPIALVGYQKSWAGIVS